MVEVNIERASKREDGFKKKYNQGDLVEYPDGTIIMVTEEDVPTDTLEGVALREGKGMNHLVGEYSRTWHRSKSAYSIYPIELFSGVLTLEQYAENKSNFKSGDLIEYPDGMILMVTDVVNEGGLDLEGVVLSGGRSGTYDVGHFDTYWSSGDHRGTPTQFNGKLTLKQHA
jgi:hypothetical protein